MSLKKCDGFDDKLKSDPQPLLLPEMFRSQDRCANEIL